MSQRVARNVDTGTLMPVALAALVVAAPGVGNLGANPLPASADAPPHILWMSAGTPPQKQALFVPVGLIARIDWSDPRKADLSSLQLGRQEGLFRSLIIDMEESRDCRPSEDAVSVLLVPPHSQTLAELIAD